MRLNTKRKFFTALAVLGAAVFMTLIIRLTPTLGDEQTPLKNPKPMTAESVKAGEAIFF